MTYRLPDCLATGDEERARGYLETYYGTTSAQPYTGSYTHGSRRWGCPRQSSDTGDGSPSKVRRPE